MLKGTDETQSPGDANLGVHETPGVRQGRENSGHPKGPLRTGPSQGADGSFKQLGQNDSDRKTLSKTVVEADGCATGGGDSPSDQDLHRRQKRERTIREDSTTERASSILGALARFALAVLVGTVLFELGKAQASQIFLPTFLNNASLGNGNVVFAMSVSQPKSIDPPTIIYVDRGIKPFVYVQIKLSRIYKKPVDVLIPWLGFTCGSAVSNVASIVRLRPGKSAQAMLQCDIRQGALPTASGDVRSESFGLVPTRFGPLPAEVRTVMGSKVASVSEAYVCPRGDVSIESEQGGVPTAGPNPCHSAAAGLLKLGTDDAQDSWFEVRYTRSLDLANVNRTAAVTVALTIGLAGAAFYDAFQTIMGLLISAGTPTKRKR